MESLLRYWHTMRFLRWEQIHGRLISRLRRPRVELAPAPEYVRAAADWVAPARRAPSLTAAGRFRFLGAEHSLDDIGWDNPGIDRLWRYHQHYFDDLNARDASSRREWHESLLARWIEGNPPARGTGWEPYPTSLRIVNWIKWHLGGNALPPECVESLAVQVRWLSRRLERHLLGNHLFANAKALVFAGLFFDAREADAWLEIGLSILEREIPEQILPDGGQFELTPMYHALALEDVLDLCNLATARRARLADRAPVSQWRRVACSMNRWLADMSHPDGEIAFFNDAAMGIAPLPIELTRYLERLRLPCSSSSTTCTHLAQTGYVRLQDETSVAFLDVGRIGPDYLPAHAHADTLSFELSLFGHRVFVNSGTSTYVSGVDRAFERGTSAHNTVVIDGQNSSEVWGAFRVARRARPVGLQLRTTNGVTEVTCAHDGYHRLPGYVTHRRTWRWGPGELAIVDRLDGRHRSAEARFLMHPRVTARVSPLSEEQTQISLALVSGRATIETSGGKARVEPAMWSPTFGIREPTSVLVLSFARNEATTRIIWGR